jgi:two-component system response regulator
MAKHFKPITILMADDDEDDRDMTQHAFADARLANDLRFVCDGEELMDYLKRRGKYRDPATSPRPAILLLDLNMPKKDGREALEEIKADPALRQIRIIILTTSRDDKDVYQAYDVSAASYITKPVNFDGLVEAIKALGKYWLETVELPQNEKGGVT